MKAAKKKIPAKKAAPKKVGVKTGTKKKAGTKNAVSKTKALDKKKKSLKKPVAKKTAEKTTTSKKQKKKEDLMCFLTTACVHQYGLADNCYELETLRRYRDTYLLADESGKEMVKEYYAVAPKIVQQISKHPKKENYYAYIYQCVQGSCRAIEDKQPKKARAIYQRMVMYLKKQVIVGN